MITQDAFDGLYDFCRGKQQFPETLPDVGAADLRDVAFMLMLIMLTTSRMVLYEKFAPNMSSQLDCAYNGKTDVSIVGGTCTFKIRIGCDEHGCVNIWPKWDSHAEFHNHPPVPKENFEVLQKRWDVISKAAGVVTMKKFDALVCAKIKTEMDTKTCSERQAYYGLFYFTPAEWDSRLVEVQPYEKTQPHEKKPRLVKKKKDESEEEEEEPSPMNANMNTEHPIWRVAIQHHLKDMEKLLADLPATEQSLEAIWRFTEEVKKN